MDQFQRTSVLLSPAGIDRLAEARVAVFGIGGVGGYVCEALVRSGLGHIALIDNDTVAETNLNRQIIALHSTIGRQKTEVMAERLRDINPSVDIATYPMFYLPETADQIDLSAFDYVVDAVDTVVAKLELIVRCKALHVPILCAMGAGNKLDPSQLRITDISKTSVDPLAKVIRVACKKRHIHSLKVAWTTEPVIPGSPEAEHEDTNRRSLPGSAAFVPSAMGLLIASQVVKDLLRWDLKTVLEQRTAQQSTENNTEANHA